MSRRGERLKTPWRDRDGAALFHKRLEVGTFESLHGDRGVAAVEIDASGSAMLLTLNFSGVWLASVRCPRRYARAG